MITGKHIRAARAVLGLDLSDVAEAADISRNTVSRIERGAEALASTIGKIQRVLEAEGIEFLNTGSPGIRWRG